MMKSLSFFLLLSVLLTLPAVASERGGNLGSLLEKIRYYRMTKDCRPFYNYCESDMERKRHTDNGKYWNNISVEDQLPGQYREEFRVILDDCCG